MQLKELSISIMNRKIFDLDTEQFVDYDPKYDDYYIVQIFADIVDDRLSVCIDVTKTEY